jgi:hypothetical protein
MPSFIVEFSREARVPCVARVTIEAEDIERAEDAAEDMLAQGLVDFAPALRHLEYTGNASIRRADT